MKNRDEGIDVLRTIGVLSIILAHVNPPSNILNVRSFDVVLLVFVSGMSYAENTGGGYMTIRFI